MLKSWSTVFVCDDCDIIFNQIMFVKHAYVKDRGKQMIHLIVSAPVFIRYADEDVWEMGRQIADIFRGHQVVFAVHDDIQYMHLHFAINTICMFDGSTLQFNPPCLREKMSRIIQVQALTCRISDQSGSSTIAD